ncbi:hypothetical protein HaLaN_22759 [Haematococcus lacustris]|uniref:Uncharacterized protein n=1 Tax=Haematococcus lacustris TaxID=44745 RepID=A0A699ZPW5_HAELA|nr:hypothetical protein HaLaN_22759 [Haematococcus lacustris]
MLRWHSGALADPRPRHPAALQYRQRSASSAPRRELLSRYGPCLKAPCLNTSKYLAQGQLAASRSPDEHLCDPHSHRAPGALPSLFRTAAKLLGTVALVLSAASIGSVAQARAETRGTAISSTAFSATAPSSTPYRGSASAHGSLPGQPATSTSRYRHTGIDLAEGQQASTGDGAHDVRPRVEEVVQGRGDCPGSRRGEWSDVKAVLLRNSRRGGRMGSSHCPAPQQLPTRLVCSVSLYGWGGQPMAYPRQSRCRPPPTSTIMRRGGPARQDCRWALPPLPDAAPTTALAAGWLGDGAARAPLKDLGTAAAGAAPAAPAAAPAAPAAAPTATAAPAAAGLAGW